MLENRLDLTDEQIEAAARRGPWGAVAVCAIAVSSVIGMWFAFYFLAFLPRGVMH